MATSAAREIRGAASKAEKHDVGEKPQVIAAMLRRLKRHTILAPRDEAAFEELTPSVETAEAGDDLVHQGDKPNSSIFILDGTMGRYHTRAGGDRQYLSLHIAGDFPDLQSLFLQEMDHSLVAFDRVRVAFLPHDQLRRLIARAPNAGAAMWRQTLLDAAIFRQAVTVNGLMRATERVAHLFCEHFARARQHDLAKGNSVGLPLTQTQVGQMLGLSIVSVSRALGALRKAKLAELREGKLTVHNWKGLQRKAGFDPCYLHIDLCAEPMPGVPSGGGR